MPDAELTCLMSDLARLTSSRSSTPRSEALGIAYRKIQSYATPRTLSEEWCDKVMMLFISRHHEHVAA